MVLPTDELSTKPRLLEIRERPHLLRYRPNRLERVTPRPSPARSAAAPNPASPRAGAPPEAQQAPVIEAVRDWSSRESSAEGHRKHARSNDKRTRSPKRRRLTGKRDRNPNDSCGRNCPTTPCQPPITAITASEPKKRPQPNQPRTMIEDGSRTGPPSRPLRVRKPEAASPPFRSRHFDLAEGGLRNGRHPARRAGCRPQASATIHLSG